MTSLVEQLRENLARERAARTERFGLALEQLKTHLTDKIRGYFVPRILIDSDSYGLHEAFASFSTVETEYEEGVRYLSITHDEQLNDLWTKFHEWADSEKLTVRVALDTREYPKPSEYKYLITVVPH